MSSSVGASVEGAFRPSDSGELTSDDFAAFFREIHDCDPFPWQQRLTAHVLERHAWPRVIDLPTGTGKTAVLDTAVFAMAAQPAISPRRVVFVIDRRIVVDQVYERAHRIRDRIEDAATPLLKRIRERLRDLSGGEPLGVAALRGGIPMDGDWADRPDQPWVVVSTVDQFGSRLLFRGYGVTPGMRPIHAGLAGNDCLVILDEVHLSVPFAETLAKVSTLHRSDLLPRRFSTVEMSATPSDERAERFRLLESDLAACDELRRRVEASKLAELVSVPNRDAVPATVLRIVKSIARSIRRDESRIRRIGVVVNRVRTARDTHDMLANEGHDVHLITGRMRPLDRIGALDRIGPVVDPDDDGSGDQLSVVVATQAIEVGADFSFDALVTECAAVDSLRQRFGRLDRRGAWLERTGCSAQAWIIGPKSVVGARKPDPVYGESIRMTWEVLERRFKQSGPLDVGPNALREFPNGAYAPRAEAPLLLGTHMDAWVQTRPEPLVQPSVEWFLHGIDQNRPADVSIAWRWDRSEEALRLVPPRQPEFLQVPIAAARSWLAGSPEVDVADVLQPDHAEERHSTAETHGGDWVRWVGFGSGVKRDVEVREIRPGDVLVVDPTRGGLNAGTWDPSSREAVEDLGDAAQIEIGRKATLRLDPRLTHMDSAPTPDGEVEADVPVAEQIGAWLGRHLAEANGRPHWIRTAIERLGSQFEVVPTGIDDDTGRPYYILIERHRETGKAVVDPAAMDGSDEAGSFTSTGVTLRRHLDGVGERAGNIAERLGMPAKISEDIRLAGRLHDLGKVDLRFQLQLVGGDPVELEMRREEPLAKSLPLARRVRGYPEGMRHEVASVAMVESNGDVLAAAHDMDLVLHLIGTHHGWARPLPPIVEDPSPRVLSFGVDGHLMESTSDLTESALALDMADRFWRLVERYGYHGLAWLEAVLRLADHQQSAEEAKRA